MIITPFDAPSFVESLLGTDDERSRRALILGPALPDENVREVTDRMLAEADGLLGVNPRRMERVSRDAGLLAERAGDLFLQTMARMKLGDSLRFQFRNEEAASEYQDAERAFRELARPVEAARTRIGWAWVTAALGRPDEALKAARAARRVLVAHNELLRVAGLDMTMGFIYAEHGRTHEALRCYSRALKLHLAQGTGGLPVARAYANRGLALTILGRYREALQQLERAQATYAPLGDSRDLAQVLRAIGEHEMTLGRYAAALRSFAAARSMFSRLGVETGRVRIAIDIADCCTRLGRPADSLAGLDEISGQLQQSDNTQWGLGVAIRRVAALLALGQPDVALQALAAAEQASPAGGLQHRAWLAAQRSAIALGEESPVEALLSARRAETLARAAGMRRLVADARVDKGLALLALGSLDDAARQATAAQRIASSLDAAPVLYRAHELQGMVAEARGLLPRARSHYAKSLQQLEREQKDVIFEFRSSFSAGRGLAYGRLAALQVNAGLPLQALATVERAKSRALVDAITGRVDLRPRGSPVARRLGRELSGIREEYNALFRDDRPEVDAVTSQQSAALEQRMTGLVHQLQIESVSRDDRDLYGIAAPKFGLPSLPEGTALLEYFFNGPDILRFLVDQRGVSAQVLTGALPEVERLMRSLRLNLGAAEHADPERREALTLQAQNLLQRLHERLLGGLDLDAYPALVIVPHGILHYLPFHALYDGERYVVEHAAVSYAPSATMYDICRRRQPSRRRGGALVLGNSAGGRLPLTLEEADAVATQLGTRAHLEGEATRALIETQGRRAGIIHIAAHGQFRPDAPLFSAIELADGPLTTADVFGLDLKAALVVLSACETGRSALGGGDELVGAARAFLYAGASSLLVSQWRVDDASTAGLMQCFYREISAGLGAASALQAAQAEYLRSERPQSGSRHPFLWAAFQVIGDDQGLDSRDGFRRSIRN